MNFPMTFTVLDRQSMDSELDVVVSAAMEQAVADRCHGILVTRHDANKFTVALTDAVPFGLTRECQAW